MGVRAAFAAATGDEETMLGAVRLEQGLVVAYRTLAGSSALDADAAALARHFGDQEQAHLDAVSKQLQTLGGVVPGAPGRTWSRPGASP